MGQDESLDADRVAFGLCGRHTSTDDLRPALSGVRGERGGVNRGDSPRGYRDFGLWGAIPVPVAAPQSPNNSER